LLLKDILEEFILELQVENYSPRTIKGYRNNNLLMFTFVEKEFGLKEIKELKTIHIKAYINFWQNNKRKTLYINSIIKCFRAFFKYAIS